MLNQRGNDQNNDVHQNEVVVNNNDLNNLVNHGIRDPNLPINAHQNLYAVVNHPINNLVDEDDIFGDQNHNLENYIINENDRNIANNVQQLLPQQEQPNQIGNVQNNNDINQDRVDAFNGEYLRLTRTLNNQINQDRRNNFNPYNFEGLNNNQNNQEVINAVNQRMQEIAGELGDRLIVPPINHANNNFAQPN